MSENAISLYLKLYLFVKLVSHFMGLEKRDPSNKKPCDNYPKIMPTKFFKILVLVALKALLKIRTIYTFLIRQKAQI